MLEDGWAEPRALREREEVTESTKPPESTLLFDGT